MIPLLLIFFCTLAIDLLARWPVKRSYAGPSRPPILAGFKGGEAVPEILYRARITDVGIIEHEKLPGDHDDPRRQRV